MEPDQPGNWEKECWFLHLLSRMMQGPAALLKMLSTSPKETKSHNLSYEEETLRR
jgi:hypothetical protein